MTISVLVYGTLKRGQWNHDRFCRHALDIRPATTVGRLYDLPAGFPALEIPEETILANGTDDPVVDAETQASFAALDLAILEADGDWDVVHGELITFADSTASKGSARAGTVSTVAPWWPPGPTRASKLPGSTTWRGSARGNASVSGCGRFPAWTTTFSANGDRQQIAIRQSQPLLARRT